MTPYHDQVTNRIKENPRKLHQSDILKGSDSAPGVACVVPVEVSGLVLDTHWFHVAVTPLISVELLLMEGGPMEAAPAHTVAPEALGIVRHK